MPNFDFDAYNHDQVAEGEEIAVDGEGAEGVEEVVVVSPVIAAAPATNGTVADAGDEVDKW